MFSILPFASRVLLIAAVLLAFSPVVCLAGGIPITGQVLADGEPLPEARVLLLASEGTFATGERRLAGGGDLEPVAETRTDADGLYRLEAPGVGFFAVRVELDGWVPKEHGLGPLLHAVELPPADLDADAGFEVRVTAGGKPAGARLLAFPTDPTWSRLAGRTVPLQGTGRWARAVFFGTTDEKGKARVPATGEEKEWLIEVAAPGFAPVRHEGPAGGRQNLELAPGARFPVETVDARGEPIAGALILAAEGFLPIARSDDNGRVELALASEGSQSLKAFDAEGRHGTLKLEPPVPGKESELATLALEEPRKIRGNVVAEGSREPIAGALVWAGRPSADDAVVTGARGEYSLVMPTEPQMFRDARVQAAAVGHVPGMEPARSESEVGPTIALGAATRLAGRVVDVEDAGIAGVEIEISAAPGPGMRRAFRGIPFQGRWARSSRDGGFDLPGLPAGQGYELKLTREGFAPAKITADALEPAEARTDLRAVLYRGLRAVGTVVDERDVPIAGAEVRLAEQVDRRRGFRFGGEESEPPGHSTDADGRFAVPDLSAGRYDLQVEAEGYGSVSVPGVELPEGAGDIDLGTVVLPPGVTVEGRVVDSGGQPLAGVEIHATEPSKMSLPAAYQRLVLARTAPDAVTAVDGHFAVKNRRAGERLDLNVAREGYVPQTVSGVVAPPEEPLSVVLQPASRVTGRVVDEDGDPIAEAALQARPEGLGGSGGARFSSFNRARSGEDGRFELLDVEPGKVTVVAEAQGFQRTQISGLEAPAGGELSGVELVLSAGVTISGVVLDADSEPVRGARVSVSATGGPGRPIVFIEIADGDGRFELTGIGLGPLTVTAEDDSGSGSASKSLEVTGDQEIELRFEDGVEVSGRVVGPDGTGVAGAEVVLSKGTGNRFWGAGRAEAASATGGAFTLENVTPGSYQLSAAKEGFARAQTGHPIEVGDAPLGGLEIRLEEGITLTGRVLGLEIDELALVEIRSRHSSGRADFEGNYTLANLSPGEVHVRAEIPGTGRQVSEHITLEEGVTQATLDLEFGSGYLLTGTVVVGEAPLSGARVRLAGVSVRHFADAGTDLEGRFRIEGLEAGTYNLWIHSFETGVEHNEQIEVLADDDVRVEIGSGRVAGQVRGRDDSAAVADVVLTLEKTVTQEQTVTGGRSTFKRATSDSVGYFSFGSVQEGSWKLRATKAGYAELETVVEMRPGDVVDDLDLLLSPAGRLTFEVVDAAGIAPSRVQLAVLDDAGRRIAGSTYNTVEGGRVEITTVPDGSWEILLKAGDSATASLRVAVPGTAGRVQLAAGGGVEVEVPDLGDGLTGAELRLVGPGGLPHRTVGWNGTVKAEHTLRGGKTTVTNLVPGPWTVTVTAADGRTWSAPAMVAPGEPTEVTLN
ncbi:MAG: hypothetical protein GY719_26810 [bacterium]|nr:hypothetical protein [bacterium]